MVRDTFQYDGKYFSFTASLTTKGRKNSDLEADKYSLLLNTDNIVEFWYENKINNLIPTATLEYIDTDATIDKFTSYQYVQVSVTISRREIKTSGDTKIEQEIEGEKITFNFWLDNIEIKSSKPNEITYVLRLVHMNALNLRRITEYTSYESGKNIIDSIKEILTQGNLKIDLDSFNNINSDVIIPYISNGTDTLYDSIRYLQSKQFYTKNTDKTLKMLTMNDRDGSYCVFDFTKESEWQTSRPYKINMVKNSGDPFATQDSTNIAFVGNKSGIDVYQTQFKKVMNQYDITTNEFTQTIFDPSQIINIFNQDGNGNQVDIEPDGGYYTTSQSYWNNTQDIYLDMIENIIDGGGLKINVAGSVGISPGDEIGIVMSYDNELMRENGDVYQEYRRKFESFNGNWFASRVVYRVFPKDCKFRQIISLMRIEDKDPLKTSST